MALVVLLRGVNVGGHRTFRPTALAAQLRHVDTVNIGAAAATAASTCDGSDPLDAALLEPLVGAYHEHLTRRGVRCRDAGSVLTQSGRTA